MAQNDIKVLREQADGSLAETLLTPAIIGALGLSASSYVICKPGDDIQVKYTEAKALTPNGAAKSNTNRATLLLMPGVYDLGRVALVLDTQFVDVVGAAGDPQSTVITASVPLFFFDGRDAFPPGINPADWPDGYSPPYPYAVAHTANCSSITGVTIRNTDADTTYYGPYPGVAYSPGPSGTRCEKVAFEATSAFPWGATVSGTFVDCFNLSAANPLVGGESYSVMSGTFKRCTGIWAATCSGVFEDCTGSFGANCNSGPNWAKGTFSRCTGDFGWIESGSSTVSTENGKFTDCTGRFDGDNGFSQGTFINCVGTGTAYDFGRWGATGTYINCRTNASDSFGGYSSASGYFKDCVGGASSFCGPGTFINCIAGAGSFIADRSTDVTRGTLIRCTLTSGTFYPLATTNTGYPNARMIGCVDGNGDIVEGAYQP